jgi:hypothetical protein
MVRYTEAGSSGPEYRSVCDNRRVLRAVRQVEFKLLRIIIAYCADPTATFVSQRQPIDSKVDFA